MTSLRESAQQALEALGLWATGRDMDAVALNDLIFRLEAALAEPVQEPVAWYHVPHPGNGISPVVSMYQQREPSLYGAVVPLYIAPPQRKPLTEEEIGKVAAPYYGTMGFRVEAFARAIERAHGIEK